MGGCGYGVWVPNRMEEDAKAITGQADSEYSCILYAVVRAQVEKDTTNGGPVSALYTVTSTLRCALRPP